LKANRGLLIAVIVLSLLVIGLSGYLVYDMVLRTDEIGNDYSEQNNNDEITNEEEYSIVGHWLLYREGGRVFDYGVPEVIIHPNYLFEIPGGRYPSGKAIPGMAIDAIDEHWINYWFVLTDKETDEWFSSLSCTQILENGEAGCVEFEGRYYIFTEGSFFLNYNPQTSILTVRCEPCGIHGYYRRTAF